MGINSLYHINRITDVFANANEFLIFVVLLLLYIIITVIVLLIIKIHDRKKDKRIDNAIHKKDAPKAPSVGKSNTAVRGNFNQYQYSKTFNAGESKVIREIERIIEEKDNYFLINDVSPYSNQYHKYTQIDHVLITPYGVFALETKYWNGDTYLLKMLDKQDIDTIDDNLAPYKNTVIVNMNDGELNLYKNAQYINAMKQTVNHATALKEDINRDDVPFVHGVLVFVTNEYSRLQFTVPAQVGHCKIVSLDKLKEIIQRDSFSDLMAEWSQNTNINDIEQVKQKILEIKNRMNT